MPFFFPRSSAVARLRPLAQVAVVATFTALASTVHVSVVSAQPTPGGPVQPTEIIVATGTGIVNNTISSSSTGWSQRTYKYVQTINFRDNFSGPSAISSSVLQFSGPSSDQDNGDFVVVFEHAASGNQLPPTLSYSAAAKAFAHISGTGTKATASTRVYEIPDFNTTTSGDNYVTAKAPLFSNGDGPEQEQIVTKSNQVTFSGPEQAEDGLFTFDQYSTINTTASRPSSTPPPAP